MRQRLLVAVFICAVWHGSAQEPVFTPAAPPPLPPGEPSADGPAADPVAAAMASLDLRGRISQLMLVNMLGRHQPSPEDLQFLKDYRPGGVVVPKMLQPAAAAVYIEKLRGLERVSGIPLLIGTDLYQLARGERHAESAFVQLPSPLAIAAANDDAATADLAAMVAEVVRVMGFNLHLGPSLALVSETTIGNGDIYGFGSDARFAARAGAAFFKAFQDHGVLGMPMGFPGGASKGSEPAVLLTPAPLLAEHDLLPYEEAVESGVSLIHVGNTLVPTVAAASVPASMAPEVLRDLLRMRLEFEGVAVAGPLDARALASQYDTTEAAVRALNAGADMLYWVGGSNVAMRVVNHLALEVTEGRLDPALVDAAARRVLTLKQAMAETGPAELKPTSLERLGKSRELAQRVRAIERRSITVVRNNGVLPLREDKSAPAAMTGVLNLHNFQDAMEDYFKPIPYQPITTALHLGEIQDFEIQRLTSHMSGLRTLVCVFSGNLRPRGMTELIHEMKAAGTAVVAVLVGFPEHLPALGEADALVLAYADSATYGETLDALAEVLMGEGPLRVRGLATPLKVRAGIERAYNAADIVLAPAGRLPVSVSDRFPEGLAACYDLADALKKAVWDFGNGDAEKGLSVVYAYPEPGTYTLTLTVEDARGEARSGTFEVIAERAAE